MGVASRLRWRGSHNRLRRRRTSARSQQRPRDCADDAAGQVGQATGMQGITASAVCRMGKGSAGDVRETSFQLRNHRSHGLLPAADKLVDFPEIPVVKSLQIGAYHDVRSRRTMLGATGQEQVEAVIH